MYRDSQDREDWRMGVKSNDPEYTAWVIQEWPRQVLDMPFQLGEDRRIPLKIWDEMEAKDVPICLMGGPQPKKWIRAKRRKRK